jgi:hypothetical protein
MYGVHGPDGNDIPSKTKLKQYMKDTPGLVVFYDTSAFSPEMEKTGQTLTEGKKYAVVGPNPYNSRKWYATVIRTVDGRTLVS